jgi:hypothetical protein
VTWRGESNKTNQTQSKKQRKKEMPTKMQDQKVEESELATSNQSTIIERERERGFLAIAIILQRIVDHPPAQRVP